MNQIPWAFIREIQPFIVWICCQCLPLSCNGAKRGRGIQPPMRTVRRNMSLNRSCARGRHFSSHLSGLHRSDKVQADRFVYHQVYGENTRQFDNYDQLPITTSSKLSFAGRVSRASRSSSSVTPSSASVASWYAAYK